MSNPAFEALNALANLSRTSAQELPSQVDTAPRWSGVGFSLMGKRFVAPLGQVTELMEVPNSTTLPGVQPWVIGLSNVRGRLLPLFDLAKYFGGKMSGHKKHQRVLVLETDILFSGLVVDSAFGMQHFSTDKFSNTVSNIENQLVPFIEGTYEDDAGESWNVFSVSALTAENKFTNVAL